MMDDILYTLGEDHASYFGAIAPPIIQSSNFTFDTLDAFRQAVANEHRSHLYSRGINPTVDILRTKLAALEGTEAALVFSSGSAAVAAAVLSQVKQGDHILCVQSPYSWTKSLLLQWLPRFGVEATLADGTDMQLLEAAILPNTRLLYLESPNSLLFELQDIAACVALAKKHNLVTCLDNSYASPVFQQPARLGIDLVIHAGTKYLNGHSDLMMGVVCGAEERIRTIFYGEYMTLGAIPSPHDAWLAIRGLRTLPLRMQRSHESGLKVASWLQKHPFVASVIHPWLPQHPQHALAKRQMTGTGGLFAFHLKAETIEQVESFIEQLKHIRLAVSWGGYESLVLPSAAFHRVPGRNDSPMPFTLVRIYIGLEDPNWLIEDLEQAFRCVFA